MKLIEGVNAKKCTQSLSHPIDQLIPFTNFHKDKKGVYGLQSMCKHCIRLYHKKRNYGVDPEEYEKLLRNQNYLCAIKSCETKHTSENPLCLDHCHKTGKIRGFLCAVHNKALGKFNDDIEVLLDTVEYLKQHSSESKHPIKKHIPCEGRHSLCGALNAPELPEHWQPTDFDSENMCEKCIEVYRRKNWLGGISYKDFRKAKITQR